MIVKKEQWSRLRSIYSNSLHEPCTGLTPTPRLSHLSFLFETLSPFPPAPPHALKSTNWVRLVQTP